jgi:hypothetical protein
MMTPKNAPMLQETETLIRHFVLNSMIVAAILQYLTRTLVRSLGQADEMSLLPDTPDRIAYALDHLVHHPQPIATMASGPRNRSLLGMPTVAVWREERQQPWHATTETLLLKTPRSERVPHVRLA